MKITILILVFFAGAAFGRWDAKHGAEAGYKWGRWTRIHVFRLPPLEEERPRVDFKA